MMKIVIGSTNKPKRLAVEQSFSKVFKDESIAINCISTVSGVSAHPVTAEETLAGAINRANHAAEQLPGADYYVGIEGGLIGVGDRVLEVGIVAINDPNGRVYTGMSAGIELSGAILHGVQSGIELGDVLNDTMGINPPGNSNGFYGLATNNLVTRQAAYEQAIIFALAPIIHPEFYKN